MDCKSSFLLRRRNSSQTLGTPLLFKYQTHLRNAAICPQSWNLLWYEPYLCLRLPFLTCPLNKDPIYFSITDLPLKESLCITIILTFSSDKSSLQWRAHTTKSILSKRTANGNRFWRVIYKICQNLFYHLCCHQETLEAFQATFL